MFYCGISEFYFFALNFLQKQPMRSKHIFILLAFKYIQIMILLISQFPQIYMTWLTLIITKVSYEYTRWWFRTRIIRSIRALEASNLCSCLIVDWKYTRGFLQPVTVLTMGKFVVWCLRVTAGSNKKQDRAWAEPSALGDRGRHVLAAGGEPPEIFSHHSI